MEFKPDMRQHFIFSSLRNDGVRNGEYFAMFVYNNVALIEGAIKRSIYDRYTDAPLTVKPGQWELSNLTVERPSADSQMGKFVSM